MQILVPWKPLSLVKWIFKVTEFREIPKFIIFQEALFSTLALSTNLVAEAVQIETGYYTLKVFTFLSKADHFWSSHAFSKK